VEFGMDIAFFYTRFNAQNRLKRMAVLVLESCNFIAVVVLTLMEAATS
jgi:hypothetical protein